MSFTQETFFGASIRNWQSSIGWENTPASCTVNVVVDTLNGDSFVTPIIGQPATLQYQTWSFSGIVESYKRTNSSSANPEYSIRLVDAREILDAAKVIVGSYTGSVLGVPNLYNVYGLYESGGYGNSGWNEAGMPWANVKNGLLSLINGSSPLSFRGYNYLLDLSWLPSMPADYRIPGPSLSILEFISQVCRDGGHDFFVQLVGNIITVKTISRVAQPASFNEINAFVSYVGGQVSSEAGRELRNETTSKMVIGGQRVDMWFQPYNGQQGSFASIWPFWGFSPTVVNGSTYFFPIIGTGTGNSHNFDAYIGHLGLPLASYYNITVLELRAALSGYENWLFFMSGYKPGVITSLGGNTSVFGEVETLLTGTYDEISQINPLKFQTQKATARQTTGDGIRDRVLQPEGYLQALYRLVSSYAQDYYGKQFMVTIPNIGVRLNGSEYDLSMSLENGAWYDESTYGSYLAAANSGYLPYNLNAASNGDGRIQCMMRIQNYSNYNFDDIPLDSLIDSGTNMFIKAEPVGITFINPALLTGPRAVIKMPNAIVQKDISASNIWVLIAQMLTDNPNNFTTTQITELHTSISRQADSASLKSNAEKIAIMPDMALVPLKNKLSTYGPWVAIGTAGRVEVEIVDDLVPWNYGGMTPMNTIGQASVSSAITNLQESESGYVEFPGVPAVALGVPITAGGPYVTDVSVSIGEGGATTRYNMKTWTPKFGQAGKTQLGIVQRVIKNQQSFRTQLRNKITDILRSPQFQRNRIPITNRTTLQNSPHAWLQARTFFNEDTEIVENRGSVADSAAIGGRLAIEPETASAMTLDGLLAPFNNSTSVVNYIPGLTSPSNLVDFRITPQQGQLNHFITYDSFRAVSLGEIPVIGGQTSTGPSLDNEDTKERFMALRGPLMVAGYGYDVRGLPVPNREIDDGVFGAEEEFSVNHRQRSDKWRVGPVDLRWDEQRGVWVSDNQIVEGKINGGLFANSTGLLEVYRRNADGNWVTTGRNTTVTNRSNCDYPDGAFMVAAKINYEWRPIFSCGGSGDAGDRCYQGMGDEVDYEDFTCLNQWVEDSGVAGGRRAPTEEDDPGDIQQQGFTCADDYMDTFEFISNVYCIDDNLIVCTRKVCLPHSWVSVENCGDAVPPGSLECFDQDEAGFALSTTLPGELQHVSGHDMVPVLGGGDFTWEFNTRINKYQAQFTIDDQCNPGENFLLTLLAHCDTDDNLWHLSVGSSCQDDEEGNVTATASIPTAEVGAQVVWTSVVLPNCITNQGRTDGYKQCPPNKDETPLNDSGGAGQVTTVTITLTYEAV